MTSSSYQQEIFARIAEITRHDVADLELDCFLESELGVDSLKMLEIINSLLQLIPEKQKADFLQSVPMRQLMQLQTIREVVQVTQPWLIEARQEFSQESSKAEKLSLKTPNNYEQTHQTSEILDSQYFLLLGHWIVNSSSLFTTVRLQGQFDPQLAWEAWQALIARHPMLRAYFIIPPEATSFQEYQLEILTSPTPPEIAVSDLRHLNLEQKEQAIEQELSSWLNFSWKLTDWPLHQFAVLRLEDSVHQLIFANEHLIADGLSNHIVLREFLEIYQVKVQGTQAHLPPATSVDSYRQAVRAINSFQEPEADEILQEYLHTHGKESFLWNPQQKTSTPFSVHFQSRSVCLDEALTQKLVAKTKEWRLPLNSLLAAAFLKALALFDAESESFILQIPTSGRIYPEVDATDIVGSFAQSLALSFSRPQGEENWAALLNRVHQTIQRGLVKGYDKLQAQQLAKTFREKIPLVAGKLPNHLVGSVSQILKSNLFVPFTGQTHLKNNYGALQVLDYRAGGINAPRTLDVLQEIFNDSLHLFASYDAQYFSADIIDSLLQAYTSQLKALAVYQKPIVPVFHVPQQILPYESEQINSLIQVVSNICHQPLTNEHLNLDLEADLGIDSLELIRIVTRLEKQLGQVNRQALLNCRSLREMAAIIERKSVSVPEQSLSASEFGGIPYVEIIRQISRTPQAIAILSETAQVTYQQLDQLSNQVAHYLRTQGVKPGVLVGVLLKQSPLLWIGILGILKAGGAYVPFDWAYPVERIRYMLNHAEIGILLTEHQLSDKFQECYQEQLPLETVMFLDKGQPYLKLAHLQQVQQHQWSTCSQEAPPLVNCATDLMTVLYTSGSTGRPKGVMLNHQGYMNRLNWMQKIFQLMPGERVVQKTSCCFDISVWEIFWPLMVGATVCPVEQEIVRDPWRLADWIQKTRINILHFVPSLFGEFLGALEDEPKDFPDLRWLIFSGEALPMSFIQQWLDKYGDGVGLANLYGPTEASIDVTAHLIQERPGLKGETSIPIGKAIDNVYLLILDENQQPLPVGELGELWIGGIQLAQGYLKDPEKTAQAFPPNPFAQIPGQTLYRTGDFAKQLLDGNFEYHGRIDHQVKIRGFRVELGEIESILNSHPVIKEAAVVALDYGSGQKRLVAGLAGQQVSAQTLKAYLASHLPHYMIPHRLEWLPSLPKNHNGKLDRKALMTLLQGETTAQPSSASLPISAPPQESYFPVGPGQRWLLTYFEPPYQWAGYTRFRYHQPLDAEALRQSLQQLVERHPSLRTVFVQEEGKWWQKVLQPPISVDIDFYDGTQLNEQQRDQQIRGLIEQLSKDFKIDRPPLFRVIVIKIHDCCYEIALIGHHLIGDMLSSQLIFQELWLIYRQEIGSYLKPPQPLPPKASYLDLTQLLIEAEKQGKLASHPYYWLFQFPSQQSVFQVPYDRNQGANSESSAQQETWTLSKSASKTLLTHIKSYYRCNLYYLLLAPLYRLIAQWSQRSDVVISHRSSGRDLGDGRQFLDAIGNFAVNFPVGISVDLKTQWDVLVKQIKTQFEGVPMNGITFDLIGDQLPHYLYPDHHLTPVRANYLGNRTIASSEVFEFFPNESDRRLAQPEQKRTILLEFFFMVIEGDLHLTIEYSNNFHHRETIQQLGATYLSLLQQLLEATPTTKSTTPSFYPLASTELQPEQLKPLSGKVALIAGGNQEFRQAIAQKLANAGSHIACLDSNWEQSQKTALNIPVTAQHIALVANATNFEQVQSTVEKAASYFGHLDILVNLNSLLKPKEIESDPSKWQQMIEVNLFGSYHYCRSVIPYFLQQKSGKIINMGVDFSDLSYPSFCAAATGKHSIVGLTKSLAEELQQHNIQINAVCATLSHKVLMQKPFYESEILLEQLAEVILFLASSASDGITGECLKVLGKP